MRVIISIPAFNEERNLPGVISEIKKVMDATPYNYRILVYDDGSRDNTAKVAKRAGAIVVSHQRNKGLAQTFKDELKECLKLKADIIVHTDADGQYLASDIPRLIAKLSQGYDLVLGSRFRGKIERMSLMKRIGNIAFAKVFSHLVGKRITDTTTGFRAFTKEVASEINIINTFTYTQEQLIRAAKQKFKIAEIPIDTRKTRPSRLFKSPLEYAIKAWINIFRIYRDYDPIKFFGSVGLSFFTLGFIIGLGLTARFLIYGSVGHIPLTILTMLLITIGVQVILFGFLADMLRK